MAAFVDECVQGEDLGCHDPNWFGMTLVDGCFGDKGGDQALGEDVQSVDQEGWYVITLGLGDVFWRRCQKLADIHRRFCDGGGLLKCGFDFLEL